MKKFLIIIALIACISPVLTSQTARQLANAIVVGTLSNNGAAPGATNIGVLPCIANASAPSYTEGRQTAVSCDLTGGLRLASAYTNTDPCSGAAKSSAPISITTATTTVLVAASASNKLYVCSLDIGPIEAVADNIAFVEDATGSCASPDAGIIGGITAAKGWNVAASGGLTYGNGGATIAKTASTNVNVCLITDSAAEVPGVMTYVLAP